MKLNEVIGGTNDMPSHNIEQISKKHDIQIPFIEAQLKKGIKVKKEHTKDVGIAKEIALDHLWEFPDYYDRLANAESNTAPAPLKLEKKIFTFDGKNYRSEWWYNPNTSAWYGRCYVGGKLICNRVSWHKDELLHQIEQMRESIMHKMQPGQLPRNVKPYEPPPSEQISPVVG